MKTIRFGIIGCGVMGREFASAAARWCHLPQMNVRPEIIAICNRSLTPQRIEWFTHNFPQIRQVTDDYRQLLDNPQVDAVYVAVPHNAHQEIYVATLQAGKHLFGEKPFGIDKPANDAILDAVTEHADCFVRCVSQFLFFPAVQQIGRMLEAGEFGRILEAGAGFLHSSDLNPAKPINWKRTVEANGQYGCMGDLGPHALTVPLRAGWKPLDVRAILSNIMPQRPDSSGRLVPCDTWDNATLLCEMNDPQSDSTFPMTLRTCRIAPGSQNDWYIEILGDKASARYSTARMNCLQLLNYDGGRQSWRTMEMGTEVPYASITPAIHQFGLCDALLQMWAAYLAELDTGAAPARFAGCVTPAETAVFHRIFTAALQSHAGSQTIPL